MYIYVTNSFLKAYTRLKNMYVAMQLLGNYKHKV